MPVATSRTVATLITDSDSVVPGGQVRIALRLRLADGWHTYWRNPGEAGVPVELQENLSAGASIGPIEWPVPGRISEGSITTYGYTGEVVLPVTVTLAPGIGAVSGGVTAHWLTCKDIGVPEEATFSVDLPTGPGNPSAQTPLFQAHDNAVPRPSPWDATISPDGTLFVRGRGPARCRLSMPGSSRTCRARSPTTPRNCFRCERAAFTLGLRLAKGFVPESGLRGVLSVRDRGGSQADVVLMARAGPTPGPALPLGEALLFAFMGGIILNLMPCVFPILAMKAVGFATGLARGQARAHAIAYTAGVLATFAGVAIALLVARSAGAAAGWGFQFASPIFVTVMAWLLFAVGLNLSGIYRVGGGFIGMGGGLAARDGHWGSFFTGALAVLVATPCTAPFMAVAIASGLAAQAPVTVLIFLVMGLGLAAPYLALSAVPAIGRSLPRPGPWMDTFAATAGVSDVRSVGMAAVGGQSGGRGDRCARPGHGVRAAGIRGLESRGDAGCDGGTAAD